MHLLMQKSSPLSICLENGELFWYLVVFFHRFIKLLHYSCLLYTSPVSIAIEVAGFKDRFRGMNPDAVANLGVTWLTDADSLETECRMDRIDFIYYQGKTIQEMCIRDRSESVHYGGIVFTVINPLCQCVQVQTIIIGDIGNSVITVVSLSLIHI